jgi:hypothetical protein
MFGAGSIFFGSNTSNPGTPATVTAANSGTSLAGTVVQLGQPVGALGSPGKLLHSTEIPFNSFALLFSGIGAVAGAHLILEYAAAAPNNGEPFLEVQDSTGTTLGQFLFSKQFGDLSIVIGRNNGLPGNRGVKIIGENILGNPGTSRDLTLIGQGILATAPAEAQEKIIVIGSDSLDIGGAFGSYITIVGNDVFDGMGADPIGSEIIAFGNFINNAAYPGGGLGSHLIFIGNSLGIGGAATDVTIIGDGFVTSLSHIALIGTPTQNVIIGGALVGEVDDGNKLQVRGNFDSKGLAQPIRTTAVAAETFGANDYTILCNTAAGAIIVTIDPTTRVGKIGNIKKISADVNSVTLTAASGLIFDIGAGVVSVSFNTQGESLQFQSDGTNIYIL